jgi:hypothetical protein
VVLKSLFKSVGGTRGDICNRLYPEIISNVPWCVDNILQHFDLVALNHFNI